jgi:putative spermidine/putrescine transport system substrate-binding protein
MTTRRIWALGMAAAMTVGACSGASTPSAAPATAAPASEAPATAAPATDAPASEEAPSTATGIGPGEGELNLIIWAGYAERGEVDPAFDWVTPFEEATGCQVNTTEMTDSNNGVSLMQSGQYDGISASGDATTRLIAGGTVAPVDTSVFTNYANVFAGLKDLEHNTVDGVNYGVPHGRGPNLLAYNTEAYPEAPTSWDVIWGDMDPSKGKVSIYDSSIFIADAAVNLMKNKPELGIIDPYQLNDAQFAEAIALLEAQSANATYWGTVTDQVNAFTAGDVTAGTTWQFQINTLAEEPVAGVLPDEGSTGWSDTWMIAANAAHPNCMLLWMDHMMSAEANGQATVWFGEAPTSPQACEYAESISPGHCELTHATDEAYYDKIHYWSTPQEDCADDDAATTCKTQDDWVSAWTTIRGG